MWQNKLKSKVVWTSTATLIIFILKTYFGYEIPQVDTLVDLILVLATVLGIFNNPNNKNSF